MCSRDVSQMAREGARAWSRAWSRVLVFGEIRHSNTHEDTSPPKQQRLLQILHLHFTHRYEVPRLRALSAPVSRSKTPESPRRAMPRDWRSHFVCAALTERDKRTQKPCSCFSESNFSVWLILRTLSVQTLFCNCTTQASVFIASN